LTIDVFLRRGYLYLHLLMTESGLWSVLAEGETPVPIPNTAVKPLVVDGTTLATARESRTVLHLIKKLAGNPCGLF